MYSRKSQTHYRRKPIDANPSIPLRRLIFIKLTTLLLLTCSTNPLYALSCSFTFDDLNFGTIDLSSGSTFQTTGNLVANCTGTPGQRVRICPNIGSGSGGVAAGGDPRYMLNGPSQLQYNIYRNAAYTNIWGSYFWGQPPSPPQPRLRLNASGTGTRTRPVRARIFASQTGLPTGTYFSSFAGGHTLVAFDYNSVGNCAVIGSTNAVQVPFNVSATNIASCSVSSSNLDFGTAGLLTTNIDSTATISVTCPLGMAYTVGLSNGSSGTSPVNRLMENTGQQIQYGIYHDAGRTNAWGATVGTDTLASTGTGAAQSFNAYGRVPPQTTPTPATYTDVVVVTVTY